MLKISEEFLRMTFKVLYNEETIKNASGQGKKLSSEIILIKSVDNKVCTLYYKYRCTKQGPLVKWLRHRPFTAVTRVRIP